VYTYITPLPEQSAREPAAEQVSTRDRSALLLPALAAASALCIVTVVYRGHHTGDHFYAFLVWNLVLAWVPLVLALGAYASARRRQGVATVVLGVLWLLFFPNAPYLLTDFIHLHESTATPLWYDALMLALFAWTGLLLGFGSLYVMQVVWKRAVGPAASWVGVVAALALASFGVYLGRFLRFNSWDALVRPRRIAHVIRTDLESPFHSPRLVASLVLLTAALTIGYVIVYSAVGLRLSLERE
jgi:uncharacterized membrane protein